MPGTCEVCGNQYDKSFEVHTDGRKHVFDSFECAIHALAPSCAHCHCRVIGHGVDESEKKAQVAAAAATAPQGPLGITDIVQMAQSHVTDDLIISQIRSTGSIYHLSGQDVVMLKQNCVSDAVVQEMQATAYRAPRRVYSATPAYVPACSSVYVVEPAPPPVAVGFGYTRYRRW